MAADDLFVPVLADFLSFHGLKLLFETVQSLEEDLSHVLDHVFIVVNAFNQTFKLAKEALEALQKHYPEYLLPTLVRQCTKFAQASSEGVPVFLSERGEQGRPRRGCVPPRGAAPAGSVPDTGRHRRAGGVGESR